MFEKKSWKPRLGVGLNKYSIDNSDPVSVINIPDSVTQPGDAFSSENMNGLEQRISDAFDSGELGVGAQVSTDGSGSKIEAIQLGEGTNSTPRTVQAYDYRLLNADGTIPPERLTTIPEVNIVDNLESSSNTSALAAHQGKVLDEKKADKETTLGGFQAGHLAMTNGAGAAIGANSEVWYGGAIGDGAKTTNGFAGGNGAVTRDTIGELIDAIQLGTGVNSTPGTLQIYNYQLLDADGNIPAERLTNVSAGGGKAYSTIVIGTSTSGYTAPQVDYLCNGSNDSAQITAAVNALPDDGGQILLLEGRYRISSAISIAKDNVTFRGMSENSILSIPSNNFNQITMFAVTNGTSGLRFESLALDGLGGVEDNNPPYLAENTAGDTSPLSISFSNCLVRGFRNPCIKSALTDSVIENIHSDNNGSYYSGYSCINLQDNNIVSGCRDVAFTILGDSNRIIDCKIPYTVDQVAGGFNDFKVSGSYNRVTGCWINAKTEIGVEGSSSSSSYNIITGNWFYGNSFIATAINVYGTSIFAFNFYSSDYTLNSGAEVHALNNYTID